MRIPFDSLNKWIYETLSGETAVTSLVDVYDEPYQNASFPYVELNLFTDQNSSTKGRTYSENTQTLSVYSQGRGAKEMNEIVNAVVNALTTTAANISIDDNFRIVFVRYESTEAFKIVDEQGDTFRQADIRLRFAVEDALS